MAKVIWVSPTRRAASITDTTDWCAALASALMMTTVSLPAWAAFLRLADRVSTPLPHRAAPLPPSLTHAAP